MRGRRLAGRQALIAALTSALTAALTGAATDTGSHAGASSADGWKIARMISPAASSAIARGSRNRTGGRPAPNASRPMRSENAVSVAAGIAEPLATVEKVVEPMTVAMPR